MLVPSPCTPCRTRTCCPPGTRSHPRTSHRSSRPFGPAPVATPQARRGRPISRRAGGEAVLARHFHERMRLEEGFEVGPLPDLSIVAFRYLPRRGDPDAFNRKLISAVQGWTCFPLLNEDRWEVHPTRSHPELAHPPGHHRAGRRDLARKSEAARARRLSEKTS